MRLRFMRFYKSLERDHNRILEKVKFVRGKWRTNNTLNPGTFITKYIDHKNSFDDDYFRKLYLNKITNKTLFFRKIFNSQNAW